MLNLWTYYQTELEKIALELPKPKKASVVAVPVGKPNLGPMKDTWKPGSRHRSKAITNYNKTRLVRRDNKDYLGQ
mgnify:CR=1 FL=1